jgi:hypothetical protein
MSNNETFNILDDSFQWRNDIPFLYRLRDKWKLRFEKSKEKYSGKETEFTFWGGWDKGYAQGRLSMIEDVIDYLESLELDKGNYIRGEACNQQR